MNITTEQVFIVNSAELDQQNPLQRSFAMPVPVASMQAEDTQSSLCLAQGMGPPSRTQMCRLCATVTELVVPIFEGEGLQNNLADKIHQHLPIQVSVEDVLPVVLCFQCTSTLLAWHELVACCVQADAAMRARSDRDRGPPQQLQLPKDQSSSDEIKDEKSPARSDSDERPLAAVTRAHRADDLVRFRAALERFRNHVATAHAHAHGESESSSEDAAAAGGGGVDAYDDLSARNRRVSHAGAAAARGPDGRARFPCGACGARLSSAGALAAHARIHSGERPCVCHVCGAQFRAAPGLRRHLQQTHARARRLPCPRCAATLANAQNLRQHLRTHTGERPYECGACGKRFAQSGSLHAHGAVHRAGRAHACAHCPAAFRRRAALARHRARHAAPAGPAPAPGAALDPHTY